MIEVLARGVAIGALAALGAGFWTGGAGQPVRLAGVLFCIGVIAYTINSSPQLRHAAGWTLPLFHFFALGGAGLFWLFIVTLFEDRPVSPLTLAPAWPADRDRRPRHRSQRPLQQGVWIVHNLVEVALSVHALYVIYAAGAAIWSRRAAACAARSWRRDALRR